MRIELIVKTNKNSTKKHFSDIKDSFMQKGDPVHIDGYVGIVSRIHHSIDVFSGYSEMVVEVFVDNRDPLEQHLYLSEV